MSQSASSAARGVRPMPLVLVLSGFSALVLAAESLGFDASFMGIRDAAVRPVAHVLLYGLMAATLAWGAGHRYRLAWGLCLLLATAEELHQAIVPGRYATFSDWGFNALGITGFLLAAAMVRPYLSYRRERRRYRRVLIAEGAWRPQRRHRRVLLAMASAMSRMSSAPSRPAFSPRQATWA